MSLHQKKRKGFPHIVPIHPVCYNIGKVYPIERREIYA